MSYQNSSKSTGKNRTRTNKVSVKSFMNTMSDDGDADLSSSIGTFLKNTSSEFHKVALTELASNTRHPNYTASSSASSSASSPSLNMHNLQIRSNSQNTIMNNYLNGGAQRSYGGQSLEEKRKYINSHKQFIASKTFSMLSLQGNATKAPDDAKQHEVCVVCTDNYKNVLLVPCNHVVYCLECARNEKISDKCPICQKKYNSATVIFN